MFDPPTAMHALKQAISDCKSQAAVLAEQEKNQSTFMGRLLRKGPTAEQIQALDEAQNKVIETGVALRGETLAYIEASTYARLASISSELHENAIRAQKLKDDSVSLKKQVDSYETFHHLFSRGVQDGVNEKVGRLKAFYVDLVQRIHQGKDGFELSDGDELCSLGEIEKLLSWNEDPKGCAKEFARIWSKTYDMLSHREATVTQEARALGDLVDPHFQSARQAVVESLPDDLREFIQVEASGVRFGSIQQRRAHQDVPGSNPSVITRPM